MAYMEMDREEFQKTRDYFEMKAMQLMRHENKSLASVGVPMENYRGFNIQGRVFYAIQTNAFMHIINEYLIEAQNQTPDKFGTGEAYDIIEALRLITNSMGWDVERYGEFLANEQFAQVFESEDGQMVDRMLRIDLYRKIQLNAQGKNEFTGGLFHALKHFSRKEINYSIGTVVHEVPHPIVLIRDIIEAFFCMPGKFISDSVYVVLKDYDVKNNIKFVFYREENTGVHFLKTVYKTKKKP